MGGVEAPQRVSRGKIIVEKDKSALASRVSVPGAEDGGLTPRGCVRV